MIATLFDQFHAAIISNAQLYTVYKLSSLLKTFLLYRFMSPLEFNTWALVHSSIYLLLLWLGAGLQQAISRYSLYFANHPQLLNYLLLAQAILISLGIPVILCIHSDVEPFILLLSIGVYGMEAGYAILESLYHASFYNRQFNNGAITTSLIDTSATIAILLISPKQQLLPTLLLLKIILGAAFNLKFISSWKRLDHHTAPIDTQPTAKQILKHSLYSWIRIVLTTITQRNFLIHVITRGMGVADGNIFKVASDGARYFHRTIIKTIGSADMALLTHMQLHTNGSSEERLLMRQGIEKLSTQISRLALPLLGIVGVLIIWFHISSYDNIAFYPFLIMTVGFIGETLFLPYRRMLEIRQEYRTILRSYIPYITLITLLFIFITYTSIGLVTFLTYVHSVRLVTGLIIRIHVYYTYRI